jgi:hypothetical protein
MADFLIIRNKCDTATEYTNWVGEGMKAYLEGKGHSVTDLSDADASPEKVSEWLKYGNQKTMKAVIALDHGSLDAFFGEKNGNCTKVIDLANVKELTKALHVYTLACSTNGNGGLGETAINKGCFSWLGYTVPVYAQKSQPFKECIWSYMEAMAEGKTMEQCEQVLRDAYAARTGSSPIFQYNLDRLLLRKSASDMTINSHNRLTKPSPKYVSYYDCSNWNSTVEVMNLQSRRANYTITVFDRDGANVWSSTRTLSPHATERVGIDSVAKGRREGLVVIKPAEEGDEFPSLLTICDEGRNFKEGNRFVPFIRVP